MIRNQATATQESRTRTDQYLTFTLGQEEYGVSLLSVQEIRAFSPITPLPGSAPYVKGVMNLRGVVVPVVGLRERFQMASVDYDRHTVIVVLLVGDRVVGVIVDSVSDVLSLADNEIAPPPLVGTREGELVTGLGTTGGRLVALLDIHALLGDANAALAIPS